MIHLKLTGLMGFVCEKNYLSYRRNLAEVQIETAMAADVWIGVGASIFRRF